MLTTRQKIAAVAMPLLGLGSCVAVTVVQKVFEGGLSGDVDRNSLIYGSMGVIGGVAVNLLSNTAQTVIGKLSDTFVKKHPDQLNHDIQKALVRSTFLTLDNLLVFYKEKAIHKDDVKKVNVFIAALKNEVEYLVKTPTGVANFDNFRHQAATTPVEQINKEVKELLVNAIKSNAVPASFLHLFEESFVSQLQVCFTQELKVNNNAWVGFQKTILEVLKSDIAKILDNQTKIEDRLDKINSTHPNRQLPRLSHRQVKAAELLLKQINNPVQLKIELDKALDDYLIQIKESLLKIYSKLEGIDRNLDNLRNEIKSQRVHWWNRKIVVAYTSVFALSITAYILFWYFRDKSFTMTIQIVDPDSSSNSILSKGSVSINYGNKTETAKVDERGQAHFFQVPGRYRSDSTKIFISDLGGEPFRQVNPSKKYRLDPEGPIEVLIETYGLDKINGIVYDESSFPIAGATVKIIGMQVQSDSNGEFHFIIPKNTQKRFQNILVVKNGYKPASVDSVSPHTQTTGIEIVMYK